LRNFVREVSISSNICTSSKMMRPIWIFSNETSGQLLHHEIHNGIGKMIASSHYVLPQDRFPNRVKKVTRTGVQIARSIGDFAAFGGGHPLRAEVRDFKIIFFSPFNQPRRWVGIDWHDQKVRHHLHGLTISRDGCSCLYVLFDNEIPTVRFFRDPARDRWDCDLRRFWAHIKRTKPMARLVPDWPVGRIVTDGWGC
jgi:hypothetical protein